MINARTRTCDSACTGIGMFCKTENLCGQIKFLDSFDYIGTIVYICGIPMPIIPFMEGSGGNAYIQKALLNALVLTM